MDARLRTSLNDLLTPFHPQQPLDQLIVEVNRLYHDFEAETYDAAHPEIFEQLIPIWREMIQLGREKQNGERLRVLDFGCGTGFGTQQVLSQVPPHEIDYILCYDLSAKMIDFCQNVFRNPPVRMIFTTDQAELFAHGSGVNFLLTNSVLHHLPSVSVFLDQLMPVLAPNALWANGHEPSKRYYLNAECAKTYTEYQRQKRRKRLARRIINRIRRIATLSPVLSDVEKQHPAYRTAIKAYENSLFAKLPTSYMIGRLVDVQVPRTSEDALAGTGFDYQEMQTELQANWALRWIKTYSFMGSTYEEKLPAQWQVKAKALAQKYPFDGGNFSALWQRQHVNPIDDAFEGKPGAST